MKACDYSVARPDPRKLYAAGFRAVGRYLTNGGLPGKALTRAELDALQAAGLEVWLNFEESGSFSGGFKAGLRDAVLAEAAIYALGIDRHVTVYFSCESGATFDLEYLHGAAAGGHPQWVGAYVNAGPRATAVVAGGYRLWEACWGCGNPHPKASIRQTHGGQPFDGRPDAIDINETLVPDFGQIKGGKDMPLSDQDRADITNIVRAENRRQTQFSLLGTENAAYSAANPDTPWAADAEKVTNKALAAAQGGGSAQHHHETGQAIP